MSSTPSSVPVTPQIAPQLVTFKPPKRSFVIHNGKDKDRDTMFAGNIFTIPSRNKVDKLHSDTDAEGDPIPGTYVVEDIYVYSQQMSADFCVLDAERAVVHILGIQRMPDGSGSELTSSFALSGLSLLPRHAPKALWREVAEQGEHRAFLASARSAQELIEAYDVKNEKRRSAGMDAVPGGPDYQHAVYLLKEFNKLVKNEAVEEAADYVQEAESRDVTLALESKIYLEARVRELVNKAAEKHNVDKKALFKQMMADPEVRKYAQKEFTFRKKGFDAIPDEDLDEMIENDEEVEDPLSEVEKAQLNKNQ